MINLTFYSVKSSFLLSNQIRVLQQIFCQNLYSTSFNSKLKQINHNLSLSSNVVVIHFDLSFCLPMLKFQQINYYYLLFKEIHFGFKTISLIQHYINTISKDQVNELTLEFGSNQHSSQLIFYFNQLKHMFQPRYFYVHLIIQSVSFKTQTFIILNLDRNNYQTVSLSYLYTLHLLL